MAKVLSIEIGVLTTKIVEMDFGVRKPKVYRCIELETPQGAVKDGYLTEEMLEVLRDTIKNTLTKNKIRTKRVLFTVFSGKIISREIMIPAVKQHQINAVIQANVTDYFPIELDEYKISHIHLSTFKDGPNVGKHKVLVVAMEKALIEVYDKLAEMLGMHIVDIDYAGNSTYQVTKAKAGAEGILVVKLEAENAILTIIKQGNLILQRNLNYGYIEKENRTDEVFGEAIESLVGTILRVIDFYTASDENNRVEQIYCIGSGAGKEEILQLITEQTQLPCRAMETTGNAVIGKKLENISIYRYMTAIGAGVSSIGFDKEKEKERHETNYVNACVLMVIFLIVAVAAMLTTSLIPYNVAVLEQKALDKKEETYAKAKIVYDKYIGIEQLNAQVQYGNSLTRHSNDGILQFLGELEEKLPSDVEVTEFSSDDEQCIIAMRVADKETAAGVIKNLRQFTSLMNVVVESVTEEQPEEGQGEDTFIYFTVNCYYNVNQESLESIAASLGIEVATEEENAESSEAEE